MRPPRSTQDLTMNIVGSRYSIATPRFSGHKEQKADWTRRAASEPSFPRQCGRPHRNHTVIVRIYTRGPPSAATLQRLLPYRTDRPNPHPIKCQVACDPEMLGRRGPPASRLTPAAEK